MIHQSLKTSVICFLCSLVATVITTTGVGAEEVPLNTIGLLERQTLAPGDLDLSIAWPVEPKRVSNSALDLPEPRSQVVSFVKKCAELEAIPLIEIAEQEDKQVYFGINFDGFLGFYARL